MTPYREFDSSSLEKTTLSSLSVLLFEQLTGGIYVYSLKEKKLLFVNHEFSEMTEISLKEYTSTGIEAFFNLMLPENLEIINGSIIPFLKQVFNKNKEKGFSVYKYSINYRLKTKSGKEKHFFHQTTVLERDENNEPQLMLAHVSDVTGYKNDTAMLFRISGYDAEKKKWKLLADQKFTRTPTMLGKREVEIMKMLVEGQSQKVIATKLHISYFTVRAHCRHILEKTNCRSISDLKTLCHNEGWA